MDDVKIKCGESLKLNIKISREPDQTSTLQWTSTKLFSILFLQKEHTLGNIHLKLLTRLAKMRLISILHVLVLKENQVEVVFLIDCSGSMGGRSMNLAKEAIQVQVHVHYKQEI